MQTVNFPLVSDTVALASEAMRRLGSDDWARELSQVADVRSRDDAARAYLFLQFAIAEVLASPAPGKMLSLAVYDIITVLQAAAQCTAYASASDIAWCETMARIARVRLDGLTGHTSGPACGHSACSQNYIDTGDNTCVEGSVKTIGNA
jgi:hypothetical protein